MRKRSKEKKQINFVFSWVHVVGSVYSCHTNFLENYRQKKKNFFLCVSRAEVEKKNYLMILISYFC